MTKGVLGVQINNLRNRDGKTSSGGSNPHAPRVINQGVVQIDQATANHKTRLHAGSTRGHGLGSLPASYQTGGHSCVPATQRNVEMYIALHCSRSATWVEHVFTTLEIRVANPTARKPCLLYTSPSPRDGLL